ncbi:MAG: class I SAM-dependent methyltransferase [Sulfurimonas sp.]|jgi:cyclopropane fatty-acyl-phospholipid synthase-like methyltransferase
MGVKAILNLSVVLFMGILVIIIASSAYLSHSHYAIDTLHVGAGVVFVIFVFFHIYLRKNRFKKEVANLYYFVKFRQPKKKTNKGKKMFLEPIDFARMYKEHKQKTVFKGKNSGDWDNKSKEMAPRMQKSEYVEDFISRMDISKEDTVLDIGCGPGTLAIPLAKKVKHVIAIDFSSQMLEELEAYASREGITNITTHHIGWEDDWSHLPQVDIAVASRSVEVQDLDDALSKMSSHAKKACYLTYKTGGSFVDMDILDYIGKKIITKPDFWYIPILLYKEGYLPKIDYITTKDGSVKYSNADEFVTSLIWSLGSLDEKQQEKAKEYFKLYVENRQDFIKPTFWAFVAWSCEK